MKRFFLPHAEFLMKLVHNIVLDATTPKVNLNTDDSSLDEVKEFLACICHYKDAVSLAFAGLSAELKKAFKAEITITIQTETLATLDVLKDVCTIMGLLATGAGDDFRALCSLSKNIEDLRRKAAEGCSGELTALAINDISVDLILKEFIKGLCAWLEARCDAMYMAAHEAFITTLSDKFPEDALFSVDDSGALMHPYESLIVNDHKEAFVVFSDVASYIQKPGVVELVQEAKYATSLQTVRSNLAALGVCVYGLEDGTHVRESRSALKEAVAAHASLPEHATPKDLHTTLDAIEGTTKKSNMLRLDAKQIKSAGEQVANSMQDLGSAKAALPTTSNLACNAERIYEESQKHDAELLKVLLERVNKSLAELSDFFGDASLVPDFEHVCQSQSEQEILKNIVQRPSNPALPALCVRASNYFDGLVQLRVPLEQLEPAKTTALKGLENTKRYLGVVTAAAVCLTKLKSIPSESLKKQELATTKRKLKASNIDVNELPEFIRKYFEDVPNA
eukprot:6491531-Amphidinium_carterae.2